MRYNNIYFIGTPESKKERRDYQETMGIKDEQIFDANSKFYRYFKGEHIHYRYEIIDELDHGNFGQVFKCIDHLTPEKALVAVKMCKNTKNDHKNTRMEVIILKKV
jgi:dual specificity tyrosine-phosphorylation-regulated kinase 2/3/4